MGKVLIRFTEPVRSASGRGYNAQACGDLGPDELWDGWIEFVPVDGGEALRTARETKQPTHATLQYWASGLTMAYLEGALERALTDKFVPAPTVPQTERSIFDRPLQATHVREIAARRPVLDPYAVYEQGEDMLRNQLRALSRDQVETIVESYGLRDEIAGNSATVTSDLALVDELVTAVRRRRDASLRRPSSSTSSDANPSL